jgi:hypothetical protein
LDPYERAFAECKEEIPNLRTREILKARAGLPVDGEKGLDEGGWETREREGERRSTFA